MKEMRIRLDHRVRVGIVLFALITVASPGAHAQSETQGPLSRFEVSAAYMYVGANAANTGQNFNLNGGGASVAYGLTHRVAAVFDVSGYKFGLPSGLDSTMYSYMTGPRASVRKWDRIAPFAQALVGVGHLYANSGSISAAENGLAVALGGGLDLRVRSHFAVRSQAEYLMTRFPLVTGESALQSNIRLSAGIVYRFHGR